MTSRKYITEQKCGSRSHLTTLCHAWLCIMLRLVRMTAQADRGC